MERVSVRWFVGWALGFALLSIGGGVGINLWIGPHSLWLSILIDFASGGAVGSLASWLFSRWLRRRRLP